MPSADPQEPGLTTGSITIGDERIELTRIIFGTISGVGDGTLSAQPARILTSGAEGDVA